MYELFFDQGAAWFSIPAFVGSAFFLLRIVMLLVGAGHDGGVDAHGDIGHHSDSGHDFQVLSIQSIAAFMMGFGWGALAGYRAMDWHLPASLGLGCAAGGGMVYLLAIMLKGMADLQSSGTVPIEAAAGREGDVYVTVQADQKGGGQVRVNIGDRQRIYYAISASDELPTGTRIRVVKVNGDNTLTVARA